MSKQYLQKSVQELLNETDSDDDDKVSPATKPQSQVTGSLVMTKQELSSSDSEDDTRYLATTVYAKNDAKVTSEAKTSPQDEAIKRASTASGTKQPNPQKQLTMTKSTFEYISSSSDDDIINNYLERNSFRNPRGSLQESQYSFQKKLRAEPEPVKKVTLMDFLQAVDQNEKKNEEQVTAESSNILELDKEYYDLKHDLMSYTAVSPVIKDKLFLQKDHKYYGISSCITQYEDYIFVGNSAGIIRVFDVNPNENKEKKPMMDPKLDKNKVTSIYLTEDGKYLLSGYKKGTLALWNMVEYQIVKIIEDTHATEVTSAKIYNITPEEVIQIVSMEDSGKVFLIDVGMRNWLGISVTKTPLYDKRLKGAVSLAPFMPSSKCVSQFDNRLLVGIGAATEVVVCQMRPIQELPIKFKKPSVCKANSIPYLDWGFGLTPSMQERTVPVLAVAWDQMIQLIYLDDETNSLVRDGLYCSDQEINSCHFMGDSVLVILVNQTKVKVLHTKKFLPGDFTSLNSFDDQVRLNVAFRDVVDNTKYAEFDVSYQVLNVKFSVLESLKISNFNNVVHKQRRHIAYLCQDQVVKAKILTWNEYIKKMRQDQKFNWLTVLKATISIYNGELRGFAELPDEKLKREAELKERMQGLIVDILNVVVAKYAEDSNDTYEIAIRVAIEFCLNIQSVDFLFGKQIYGFFQDKGLRDKFVLQLQPFILAGSFKKQIIPDSIIKQIILQHEKEDKYKQLEKIIQQIDFSQYQSREELQVTCQTNLMVSALLYLFMEMDSNGEAVSSCIQILNTMYKMMEQTKAKELVELKNDPLYRVVTKEDIFKLNQKQMTEKQKYAVEISNCYVGYKLLWIMQMFLEGRKFPDGTLTPDQWRTHVHDIIHFITTEEYLRAILDFDPEMFFFVIEKLFKGRPWQYLSEMRSYQADCLEADEILAQFETKGLRALADGNRKMLDSFYKLVLNILITMSEDRYLKTNQFGMAQPSVKKVDLNYTVVFKALCSHLEQREPVLSETEKFIINAKRTQVQVYQVDEELVINSIKAMPAMNMSLSSQDVDTLLKLFDNSNLESTNIKIELFLARKDYVEAFECLVRARHADRLFKWIEDTLGQLKEDAAEEPEPYISLKQALQYKLHEIAEQELIEDKEQEKTRKKLQSSKTWDTSPQKPHYYCMKSYKLLTDWFGEPKLIQHFLLSQLAGKAEVQYHFLNTFVNQTQIEMEAVINASVYQPENLKEAQLMQSYLVTYVELMCEFARDDVEFWVSKDFFPADECLRVCSKHKHEMGEYKCTERIGKLAEAINILLNAINRIDCKRVLDQMDIIHMRERNDWKFGSVFEYTDGIGLFDTLLNKALAIAQKKEGRNQGNGETLWFMILEYLQNFITEARSKVEEVNRKENRMSSARQIVPTQTKIDRLKDFVMKRISYILQLEGLDISLAVIMERLKLEYQQVQVLCKFKLELFNDKRNRMASYEHVLQNDIMVLFNDYQRFRCFGLRVNSKLAKLTDKKTNRIVQKNISDQKCRLCKYAIIDDIVTAKHRTIRTLRAFPACAHVYHSDCIGKGNSCPECSKFSFKSTKEEEILDPELMKKQIEDSFAALNEPKQDLRKVKMDQDKIIERALRHFDEQLQREYLTSEDFF